MTPGVVAMVAATVDGILRDINAFRDAEIEHLDLS